MIYAGMSEVGVVTRNTVARIFARIVNCLALMLEFLPTKIVMAYALSLILVSSQQQMSVWPQCAYYTC